MQISMLQVELDWIDSRVEKNERNFADELQKLQIRKRELLEEKAARLAKKRRIQRMGPLAARKVLRRDTVKEVDD